MVISYCIPCKNRTDDLKRSLVTVIAAAKKSPPVEIVVLNYNSGDDLKEYVLSLPQVDICTEHCDSYYPNRILYVEYTGNKYYHTAHARNLSVLAATGEYVAITNADILMSEDYFSAMRELLSDGTIWMTPVSGCVIIVVQRREFIDAGGFDERFEFYGPEDKELKERLLRRGKKHKEYPNGYFYGIPTSDGKKVENYRLKLTKREMHNLMKKYLEENRTNNLLVANPDGWGKS